MQSPKKIYLVEDKKEQILLIKEAARKLGIEQEIKIITSGKEALSLLKSKSDCLNENCPKLIILDINIPAPDGFEILKAIKTHEIIRHIPVVIFTSSPHDEHVMKCYKLGANSYVTKPALFKHFIEKMRRIIEYWFYVNVHPPVL